MKKLFVAAALPAFTAIVVATPAKAEVVSSAPNGFHLRHSATLPVSPDSAYMAFAKIERWWNPSHSYSGDSKRLSLELTSGGCFCETLTNGGVEHMRVVYFEVPKRLVLAGALGPLLYEGVSAAMDLKFDVAGSGTTVTMTYKAAGFAGGGADKLAPLVDQVLKDQFARYAASARTP